MDPDPEAPPVRPVPFAGAAQAYVVPVGIVPDGAYVNVTLLHELVLCAASSIGLGLTVIVTVNTVPVQPEVLGVTLYVAVSAAAVLLVSVPVSADWAVPNAPPVMPVA
jgi:hypothetical protein